MSRVVLLTICLSSAAIAEGLPPSAAPASNPAAAWVGVYDMVGDLATKSAEPPDFKPDPVDARLDKEDALESLDDIVTAHLQPWAVTRMKSTDSAADDLGAICGPTGIFRYPSTTGGVMILQTPGKVMMVWVYLNSVGVRRIYLTDKHPRNLLPTWNGNSIGHWEGETLVVDTIGFNDKSWLQTSNQPHTEQLHVVERIHAIEHGAYLEIQTRVEDRSALKYPYTYTRHFKKIQSEFADVEYHCNREPGDQQMWNYMRNGALEQSRKAAEAAAAAAAKTPRPKKADK